MIHRSPLSRMKNKTAAALLILMALLLLCVFFGNVLLSPSHYIFGSAEDSVKNYYTFAYYIAHDHGLHFSGMNYPYGEHVIFTDDQPLFSFLISRLPAALQPNPIAFLNYLMLLAIPATAFFIYLICRKVLLPAGYSIVVSLIIAHLSPQLFRLDGHYALAYCWVIPAGWYLAIRVFENVKTIRWKLISGLYLLLLSYIHPYYILIGALFFLAYSMVFLIQKQLGIKNNKKLYSALLLTVLLPLLIFYIWLHATDPVTDRPENPYGFLNYKASLNSIFFPVESPLKDWWQLIFRTKEPVWEAYAYVSLTGLFIAIFTVIKWGKSLYRKQFKRVFHPVLPAPLQTGLWAGILTLLFAMAIPFRWNLEVLLELLPPLKQFRSTGRFAWIFYYTFGVYAAFYIYQLYRLQRTKSNFFAVSLATFFLLLWSIEATINTEVKAAKIRQNNWAQEFTGTQKNLREILQRIEQPEQNFQAILPIPYFSVGSEKIDVLHSWPNATASMELSYQTGLPIAASILSRTSLTQTFRHLQLFSTPQIEKEILQDLPSPKPFLVINTKNDTLLEAEATLLKKATKLYEDREIVLYRLPLSALKARSQEILQTFEEQKPGLSQQGVFFQAQPGQAFVYNGFEKNENNRSLFDKGALLTTKKPTVLYKQLLPNATDTTAYEASVWFYGRSKAAWTPLFRFREVTPQGKTVQEKAIEGKQTYDIYKDWLRLKIDFRLQNVHNIVIVEVERRDNLLDGFMIKPTYNDVYFYSENKLVKNNFPTQN